MSAQVIHIEARRLKPMSCPDDEALLLLTEGSDGEHEAMLEHLGSCSSCAAKVTELRAALNEWRATDLIDKHRFDDEYFSTLALDVEQALSGTARPSDSALQGPATWWKAPVPLAIALAASLLLFVSVVGQQSPKPETAVALDGTESLEGMARELGRSLLSDEEIDLLDSEDSSFLATWNLELHELVDDMPPLPLTTTLADEFELLDSESLESVVLRL